jgi:hypothetical protein
LKQNTKTNNANTAERKKPRPLICGVVAGCFAPATTRCGFHPLIARREAPHNQRIHLIKSVHDPIGLIPRFAGDPQRIKCQKLKE